jgi:hypothetical protein
VDGVPVYSLAELEDEMGDKAWEAFMEGWFIFPECVIHHVVGRVCFHAWLLFFLCCAKIICLGVTLYSAVCVCVCVCVCVERMNVETHACMQVNDRVCTRACMHNNTNYTHIKTHTKKHSNECTHTNTHTHTYIHTYTRQQIHINTKKETHTRCSCVLGYA